MGLRSIIWLITGACNLNCPHCYAYKFRSMKTLPKEEVMRVLREAVDLGLEWINFAGGEPLLVPWLLEVLKWLEDHGVETSIVTNGTLINREMARRLKLTYLYVSLDGGSKEAHEAHRPGTWERLMKTFQYLREEGVNFSTVMAVSKLNYWDAYSFVKKSKEVGADHASLIPVMPTGRALKSRIWVNSEEFVKALRDAERAAEEEGFPVSIWCAPWVKAVVKSRYVRPSSSCRKRQVLDIAPDGSVLLCDVLDFKITNVVGKPLIEVLKIVENHPLVKKVENPNRYDCPLWSKCLGGCYARALLLEGKWEGDPLCPLYVKKFKKVEVRQ